MLLWYELRRGSIPGSQLLAQVDTGRREWLGCLQSSAGRISANDFRNTRPEGEAHTRTQNPTPDDL
jgi:hypothetical protein